MNLATILTTSRARDAARVAVKLDEFEMSYAALDRATARLAAMLSDRGIGLGQRVALMLPNVPSFPVCYYGILRAGAVAVPINVLSKRREVGFYLRDTDARLLLAWDGVIDEARAGAQVVQTACIAVAPEAFEDLLAGHAPSRDVTDRDPSDTAVILYTSGTTGTPKGAELTHANLLRNCEAFQRLVSITSDSVILGALPLFHSFGQTCALNAAILSGGTLTLIPQFEPARALAVIERDRVDVFEGVPAMYNAILHASDYRRYETSTLRLCVSGGASLPGEVLRGFEAALDCKVLEGYGLSETSPVASFNHPDRERKRGSIGTPIEGVEMRLLDDGGEEVPPGTVGEIAIRGHNVMKGYWGQPEATAEVIKDGWLLTGDMARRDEEGYYFIVDRKKDVIIRGGFNIYPRELEEILYEHPAVSEAAVFGLPSEHHGEDRIAAAVALKPDAVATAEELRAYVKSQVADYKCPRIVWLLDGLPKSATGKILKREIMPPPVRQPLRRHAARATLASACAPTRSRR